MAGYRIVRRAPDRHGGRVFHGATDGPSGARTSVTIVVFDGDEGDERAMRLIERLEVLEGDCVPRVLDVCTTEEGEPVVVLDYCGDTLSSVVASGTRLQGGEVVTMAAPILAALTSVHDRGFVHGGVSLASIAIGSNGRPVLLGCERATEIGASTERRDRDQRAGDDLRAFADMLADLADAVPDASERQRARRAAETLRAGAETPFSPAVRSAAEVRLFEIAEPVPLALSSDADPIPDTRPEKAGRSLVSSDTRRRRDRPMARRVARVRRAVADVLRPMTNEPGRVSGAAAAVIGWLRSGGRRRRILVAAASGASAAAVLVLLIPTGNPAAREPVPDPSNAGHPSASTTSSAPSLSTGAPVSPTAASKRPVAPVGLEGDDPVGGARAALDIVAGCSVEQRSDCWDRVFEPGTALLDEVEHAGSAELPAAMLLPVDGLEIAQREDFGDAQLIALTPVDGTRPASVLMVRTEAGWRIREVFEA